MLDTKTNSRHCTCCMTSSGGPAWPLRCRRQFAAVSNASSMKAFVPKPHCDQSLLPHLLELLHVDFTIETMMELDQPPDVVNLLVSCDHIMKHIIVHVTPSQTAKTVAKFLWQGYISSFRALAKLLSDWGANFESNITRELCNLIGIWKVRNSP